MTKKNNSKGFSLVELIVAIGVFVIIIGSMVVVSSGSYSSSFENQKKLQVNAMLSESWEALKAIRNNDWNDITNGLHGLSRSNGYWQFSGSADSYEGITRQITVSDIKRDSDGYISEVGDVDPDSKSVNIKFTWSYSQSNEQNIVVNTYLHNYQSSAEWPPVPEEPPEE